MKNLQIAWMFTEIADLLEIQGENQFKTRAYRKAARELESLPERIEDIWREGRLEEVKGIGKGLADKIKEILETDRCELLEELRHEIPPYLMELTSISGVGVKMAQLFYQKLNIKSLAELEEAACNRQLREIPGVGARTELKIISGIKMLYGRSEQVSLGDALNAAEQVLERIKNIPEISDYAIVGALSRYRDSVKQVELLVATEEMEKLKEVITSLPLVREVLEEKEKEVTVINKLGVKVRVMFVGSKEFSVNYLLYSGTEDFKLALKDLASRKGYSLDEGKVFTSLGQKESAIKDEKGIFDALGIPFIPIELRETASVIEKSEAGLLPNLITHNDIQGDLHVHTTWSDGVQSIAEMAKQAKEKGYSYLAICDHSPSLAIARGLSAARLEQQKREIDEVNSGWSDFKVFSGVEVDIKGDGSLDHPDEILAERDIVVASIHSGFSQDREKIMLRVEKALKNPHVNIFAHPTGRLLGRREGYQADLAKVIELAAKNKVALEINASPERLDLNGEAARLAKESGVKIAINTDAHSSQQLDYMYLGIAQARRGWLESDDVINTYSIDKLLNYLDRK